MTSDTITAKELAEIMGISVRAINKRATKGSWPSRTLNGRGDKVYPMATLPADVQTLVAKKMDIPDTLLPALCPEAALAVAKRNIQELPSIRKGMTGNASTWTSETAIDADILQDPKVIKWSRIVQEAMQVPPGWRKRAWIEAVAVKHDTSFQSVYRYLRKYEKRGLAGLKHTKPKGPKAWTPEAVDWWVGLCLKREHRKIAKDQLYEILSIEAHRRDWRIGCYESALWWFNRKATPQLLSLQRGGIRALDNLLPPVLRDYSDLAPFEILVGDQHRFDFWVVDEMTGEVFRPEGYFWQDLRTRCFYGGALDKKYDSYLIGLALRMGLHIYGAFGSIYTDNGKPELSKYIMGILKDMHSLGLRAQPIVDASLDIDGMDPEEINPLAMITGAHRKAIVRNAKAKMIEGTFNAFEGIMRDHMRVPGYVKTLGGPAEENEVDQNELQALARQGKLLTFWEFTERMFRAMDYYNSTKAHRGVLKEWTWRPKPKTATPMDCLRACYNDGWRPGPISNEAIDLIFLPRDIRAVDRGRIAFRNVAYEHEALVTIPRGRRVEVRFDPLDPEYLLVFDDARFVCRAEPVEYSSMKDHDLASRKIEEKRRTRKGFILEYRKLTTAVPDFLEYSKVSLTERAAAAVGREKQKAVQKRLAEQEASRVRTPEELEAEVRALEANAVKSARKKPIPKRPAYFLKDLDRYKWIVACELAGGALIDEDVVFKEMYEARMNADERERWDVVRELGGM